MIRIRKYRAFIVIAVFLILALYYLNDASSWSSKSGSSFRTKTRTQQPLVEPLVTDPQDTESSATDSKRPASEPEHFADAPILKSPDGKQEQDFPQIELPGAPTTTLVSSTYPTLLLDEVLRPAEPSTTSRPLNIIDEPLQTQLLDIFPHPGKSSLRSEHRKILAAATESSVQQGFNALVPEPTSTLHHEGKAVMLEDEGRLELPTESSLSSTVYWSSQSEHYPVPSQSIIELPSGKPKEIPRVQYQFEPETQSEKKSREQKRDTIKKTFLRHWNGYKEFAWDHDELMPISGKFKDPFAGWRATLVDSLDVLWIMGLKDEFEEAVEAVKEIDFTTTRRDRLPLFEVTIRYMGGLVAAYDVSGMQYTVLLEKAKQLGEVLMVAFDTPNRMPQTHFGWQPKEVAKSHVGSRAAVLAELGSLSMEFTRLAQITKEPKYYDAIARITDALEGFQNKTKLPGLWPMYLDLSGGCGEEGTPKLNPAKTKDPPSSKYDKSSGPNMDGAPLRKPPQKDLVYDHSDPTELYGSSDEDPRAGKDGSTFGTERTRTKPAEAKDPEEEYHMKDDTTFGTDQHDLIKRQLSYELEDEREPCEPEEIRSPNKNDKFTIGSMADSTYEYLPKEFLLLGGLNEQYRSMYEDMLVTIKDYLLYRPMIEDETRRILFTGSYNSRGDFNDSSSRYEGRLDPETGHLSCFAGAFIGLAAKIWNHPKELDLAEQLADGCVWAYEQQATGIMPEIIIPIPCAEIGDTPCEWNKTYWWYNIDPFAMARLKQSNAMREMEKKMQAVIPPAPTLVASSSASPSSKLGHLQKRQLEDGLTSFGTQDDSESNLQNSLPGRAGRASKKGASAKTESSKEAPVADNNVLDKLLGPASNGTSEQPTRTLPGLPEARPGTGARSGVINSNRKYHDTLESTDPQTLEEVMEKRIKDGRLPPGLARNADRRYILRPEAIESVFYMFRLTGDSKWRDKGWRMFTAINKATKAAHGNSAILDVSDPEVEQLDSAESFWTAETLKYFYLLFSEPELLSLDNWALNTEAHPFRRPDAGPLDPDRP